MTDTFDYPLMPIEFEFTATPALGDKAMRYLLWRRGGPLGPIAIILLPIVIAVMATDPAMRPVAYIAGGRGDYALRNLSSRGRASPQNQTALFPIYD